MYNCQQAMNAHQTSDTISPDSNQEEAIFKTENQSYSNSCSDYDPIPEDRSDDEEPGMQDVCDGVKMEPTDNQEDPQEPTSLDNLNEGTPCESVSHDLENNENNNDKDISNDGNVGKNDDLNSKPTEEQYISDDVEGHVKTDPEGNQILWTLPPNKDICTLDEIRRGQVINKTAANECPVPGCGRLINENRILPSPGTISSGLRTHVLFVHYGHEYANKKCPKKRKLGWSNKRRQISPRKQPSNPSPDPFPMNYMNGLENCTANNSSSTGLDLIQRKIMSQKRVSTISAPGSLLNKKVKQLAANKTPTQPSSLQSLIQATGGSFNLNSRYSPPRNQKTNDSSTNSAQQKQFSQTASSLFSILAGLAQQPQQQQNQRSNNGSGQMSNSSTRNIKAVSSANTINITQCSKNTTSSNNNSNNFNNQSANSCLLSLLNEKISGNVASTIQSQLKKTWDANQVKAPATSAQNSSRQNLASPATQLNYSSGMLNSDSTLNAGTSILSSLCAGNGESRVSNHDGSVPLNSFIEMIASKTGSNIGASGVAEAKKIIEKFTTSLLCSSQTIADHYVAPYGGDVTQQKPEISPSDVLLAYKMMHKSFAQP